MGLIIDRRTFLWHAGAGMASLVWRPSGLNDLNAKPLLRFGLVTDSHYADRPEAGIRYYRESLAKMQECIDVFNRSQLDFVIHLGDFKDQNVQPQADETLHYLESLEAIYGSFVGPRYHCVGNHDVDSITKKQFLHGVTNTGIDPGSSYYQFSHHGFSCLVLDANYYADGSDHYYAEGADWQDIRIPESEVLWLKETLETHREPTFIFCHHPLFEYTHGNTVYHVQNHEAIRRILEDHQQVVAVFQGHTHESRQTEIQGIHYLTLLAMVDQSGPENNAYAIAEVYPDRIELIGYRRIADKTLPKKSR
ncbi:MAG: metallophosphoesterase [Saprospiraceae bacterium]